MKSVRLQHAHAHGIIHRDLKPSNVWFTQEGAAQLGDFGLATSLDHSRFSLEGILVGTAAYLPPEHLQGKKLEARSDLYSLGAMLYEMVAGRPPFMGDSLVSLIAQHLNVAPVAPSQYNPEIPPALDALLLQLLAKTPDERPHSASEVRTTLLALAAAMATGRVQSAATRPHALDRLVSDIFVGRERESDTLRDDLEEILAGHGRAVVLTGEPGIGKTRLATELVIYARLRGAQLLIGRCHEDEGAPPYWPWVQMLRAYAAERSSEQLQAEMGTGVVDIAQIIPDLREQFPALPAPPLLEPEQARFRFFDSFTTFLKNAAKRHPLVLFLDDLQWADPSSLLLLQFVAREISETRLLMILTCREGETTQHSFLARTLATIARTAGGKILPLRSLTASDVARFIELTTGATPSQELVTTVYQETEGHPFFMTEVVRLLATEAAHAAHHTPHAAFRVPQSVRAVIARRLEHVSEECHRLLMMAAVIGREFNLTVLEHVGAGLKPAPTAAHALDLLDEALAARLLTAVPGSVGRYSFSHALIRATLYESLSIAQRLDLHRMVGEALEKLAGAHPAPLLAELAHHFFQAAPGGSTDKAIAYTKLAAERAIASLAYEEAAAHYERALQLLDAQTPDDEVRCSLLLTLGEAWQSAGNPAAARSTFGQAAELARRLLQQSGAVLAAPLLARAALGFGRMLLMNSVGDPKVTSLLEEALTALGQNDSLLRARVLARLAMEVRFSSSHERCLKLSEQAIAVARRVGDLATVAALLGVKRYIIWTPENLEERLTVAATMVQVAEEAGNKEAKLEGLLWQVVDHLEASDLAAAQTASALHASLVKDLRHGLHLWRQAMLHASRALCLGHLDKGERLVQDALTLGQRTQPQPARQTFGIQLYRLRKDQGRLPELESLVKALVERNPTFPVWRCGLAVMYCAANRRAEAAREFAALATRDFTDFPRDMNWLIGMALLSEVCVYLGDTRTASALYSLLLPYAERNVLVGLAYAYFGSTAYYLGLLATTLQRWDAAEAHFIAALRRHTQAGARPFIAYTQCDYAHMLLSRDQPGDQNKARALLDEALATAQELGMAGLVEKVQSQEETRDWRLEPRPLSPQVSGLKPQASSAQHSALSTQHLSVFRHDGDYWTIADHGVTCRLKDARGLHYLAHLLQHPHHEFHAAELVALVSGAEAASTSQTAAEAFQLTLSVSHLGDAGDILDPQAKAQYKQRLIDLQDELQEAESFNDEGRVERLREEIDFLTQELSSAVGLGGRHRKAASQAERARVNVTRTIRAALGKIAESHPALGRQLSASIRTSIYCSYVPDPRSPLDWEF